MESETIIMSLEKSTPDPYQPVPAGLCCYQAQTDLSLKTSGMVWEVQKR